MWVTSWKASAALKVLHASRAPISQMTVCHRSWPRQHAEKASEGAPLPPVVLGSI